MIKINNKTAFVILFLILFSLSCSIDNSITGNTNKELFKPNSGGSDTVINYSDLDSFDKCVIAWTFGPAFWFLGPVSVSNLSNDEALEKSYDFRDNYLNLSSKGDFYKQAYYQLSEYSIKNNLINEYFSEHRELMIKSIPKAYELQYGNDINKIIIESELSNKFREILKIYRNHPNHREIDDVLDYLEKDLVIYENQPKSLIAKDFK